MTVTRLEAPGDDDVLLVVDIQQDFCEGGSLPVPGGDEIVPLVNRLAAKFSNVVVTQDWHPPGHQSFASTHEGRKPFELMTTSHGMQVLWPDHCVQGTPGASLHSGLDIPHTALILRKGLHPRIDSYSAFFENDRTTPTGLTGYFHERGFTRIYLAGLALDFCVLYSAEDAVRNGFSAIVVESACRAIDVEGSLAKARRSFTDHGIACCCDS
jgi:nicotinamidase/pyrazinamidase